VEASTKTGIGLEKLSAAFFNLLDIIRIYAKPPGKPADMDEPFTLPAGSTVMDLATAIHRELAEKLKFARIWGTGVYAGQNTQRNHVLNDRDVIELHFNSFFKPIAEGCETLYYVGSEKGYNYSRIFSRLVNQSSGIKLRGDGTKALSNTRDRGFASVYYTNAPTILIEPFFGSNEEDCKKIKGTRFVAELLENFVNTYVL